MATITHIGNLDLLALYQDILKDSFLVDIISLYKNEIRSMSEKATGRPQYQIIVTYLDAMLSLENVEDVVVDFIEELMATYSRRPAMKDELSKISLKYRNS